MFGRNIQVIYAQQQNKQSTKQETTIKQTEVEQQITQEVEENEETISKRTQHISGERNTSRNFAKKTNTLPKIFHS